MAIMRFNYRSQALSGWVDITITLPTDGLSYYDMSKPRHHVSPNQKPLPMYQPGMKFQTIYLIHGGGDDDSLVYRYTNAELFAERNCVMLVTPSIVNSFGVDTAYGVEYSTFLTDELPAVIQSLFPSSPKREDTFIVGYAMGGNAALGNALKRPDLYRECVDMSGGIGLSMDVEALKSSVGRFKGWPFYGASFGDPAKMDGSDYDLTSLAKRNIAQGAELPKFHFIAGSLEGAIHDFVKRDSEQLAALGYDVSYTEAEGYGHDFRLWNDYFAIIMDKLLPLRRSPIYP
jgi:putative tributyrin esterase